METPGVLASEEWGPAKEAMGQATRRVLPTDQVWHNSYFGSFVVHDVCFAVKIVQSLLYTTPEVANPLET